MHHLFVRDLPWYDDRARGLIEAAADRVPAALAQLRVALPDDARADALSLDDARLVYARQHGFGDWTALATRLEALAAGAEPEPFARAFEAIEARDRPRLEALLRDHPDLARARGTNGNTLLALAASLAPRSSPAASDEDRLALLRRLLDAGADVDAANDRGWTPLHQAATRGDVAMARLLLAAGARVDLEGHGDGGTPLVAALFWGHHAVAAVLAAAGVAPRNLRVAAALGRIALMRVVAGPEGELTAEARAHRGFYRPHSGFPRWRASDDPQEVLDEALAWAARNGRLDAMALLVGWGARLDADVYRGTPLAWAVYAGRLDAARWLLDRGADPDRRGTFGGPTHGEGITALHLAAADDRVELVDLLLARGADPTIEDTVYRATPLGWAEHCGAARAAARLASG